MKHYETNKMNWPSESNAKEINSFGTLKTRFEGCKGRKSPSLLVVNFWEVGDAVEFHRRRTRGGEAWRASWILLQARMRLLLKGPVVFDIELSTERLLPTYPLSLRRN